MFTSIDLVFHNPKDKRWPNRDAGFFKVPKGSRLYRTSANQFQAARCRKISKRVDCQVKYVLFEGQGVYLTLSQIVM